MAMLSDLRLLPDQHTVGVHESPASVLDVGVCLGEQPHRVGILVALVARREQPADIAKPGSTKEGVGERMRNHIAV